MSTVHVEKAAANDDLRGDRARTLFRVVAFAEAVSWTGLLAGMFIERVLHSTHLGVSIFGPIHGVIFIAYVLITLWVSRVFRWRPAVLLAGLASAFPPFATVIFEIWADRRGLLGRSR